MSKSVGFVLAALFSVSGHALAILHQAPCAGLLNPRVAASRASYHQQKERRTTTLTIGGRERRVTVMTQAFYSERLAQLPDDRLEVPMVTERLPLGSRLILPGVRSLLNTEVARRARALFADPGLRPRFKYAPASLRAGDLRDIALDLQKQGVEYGINSALRPGAVEFEVALGDRVYTGREFYTHLVRDDFDKAEAAVTPRFKRFLKFFADLDLRRMAQNARLPAEGKQAYRPRFDFVKSADAIITAELVTGIAAEVRARAGHRQPHEYDVVLAGRLYTGEEFLTLERRMREDGIISINAEHGFGRSAAGVAATMISQTYTWSIRAAGAIGLAGMVFPGVVALDVVAPAQLAFVSLMGMTIAGTALNGALANAQSRVGRVIRNALYVLPDIYGVGDSSMFHVVRAHRARVLVDNVVSAFDRIPGDAPDEITVIAADVLDLDPVLRAFERRETAAKNAPVKPPTPANDVAPAKSTDAAA